MLYTNWQSTGNSFEGAFGGYDEDGLWGNNSNYNSEDTIGDDYGVCLYVCMCVCVCVRQTVQDLGPLKSSNVKELTKCYQHSADVHS